MPGYKTWATNDVVTASDMNELHADPLQADVATDQATTSGSYTDLTTTGPSVTKTLVSGQKCLVIVQCELLTATDGNSGYMSFAVSGATTLAASDANGAHCYLVKAAGATSAGGETDRATVFTASASGSHTFTAKYKSDGTGNLHFINRRIIVKPF